MATPKEATVQKTAKKTIPIEIVVKGKDITVSRDPFWVSKKELHELEWVCAQDFTVHFETPNGSPFRKDTFKKGDHSGCVRDDVQPSDTPIYKYTVTVPGVGALDPKGGVTP